MLLNKNFEINCSFSPEIYIFINVANSLKISSASFHVSLVILGNIILICLMRTSDSSFSLSYWQLKAIKIIQVKTRQYLYLILHFGFLRLISSDFNLKTIKLNFYSCLRIHTVCRSFCQL